MFAIDRRRPGPRGRRPGLAPVEALETRALLAFTPLGFSLPDLTIAGSTPPVATYGGTLGVTVDVYNLGASTQTEPLSLEPGAPSRADAGPSQVGVYLSPAPRFTGRTIRLGRIDVPTVPQNGVVRVSGSVAMPGTRPRGFPGNGRNVFVLFRANDTRNIQEMDLSNNLSLGSQPVQLAAPLPDVEPIQLLVPPSRQPGDAIQPTIKIANFGTRDTNTQAPLTVLLVASTDRNFGPTDAILGVYTLNSLPPLSEAPARRTVLGDVTLDDPPNVVTISGAPVTLPAAPTSYFIGVIADPFNQIREISEIGRGPSSALSLVQSVGPATGVPPASGIGEPAPPFNTFPIPPFGPLESLLFSQGTFFGTGGEIGTTTTFVSSNPSAIGVPRGLARAKPPAAGITLPGKPPAGSSLPGLPPRPGG